LDQVLLGRNAMEEAARDDAGPFRHRFRPRTLDPSRSATYSAALGSARRASVRSRRVVQWLISMVRD
jgi:hypothetical protein